MELRCLIDSNRTLLPFRPHLISFPISHARIDAFTFNVLIAFCSEGYKTSLLEAEVRTLLALYLYNHFSRTGRLCVVVGISLYSERSGFKSRLSDPSYWLTKIALEAAWTEYMAAWKLFHHKNLDLGRLTCSKLLYWQPFWLVAKVI
jgi:hypothetical protein